MAFSSAVMSLFPSSTRAEQSASHSTPIANGGNGLTLVEKQAVIDDLQLEISKRARGLRTIYSEQARQLRESLERRIHRIPPRMRSKTMGELVDEQAKKAGAIKTATPKAQPSARPPKRTSDVAFGSEDKENAQLPGGYPDLDLHKKRPKMAQSQSPVKTNVLSPRSHNSRTYPSKIASPEKSVAKSRTTTTAAAKARPASRATSRQGNTVRKPAAKKAAEVDATRRDSDGSSSSARTTIVKPATKRAAPIKKPVAKTTTTTRKRAPAKTETAPPATTRTLRKRA